MLGRHGDNPAAASNVRGRYFTGKRASIPPPPHRLSTGSVVRLVRIPRSIHDGDCNISRAAAQKGDIILSKQRYFLPASLRLIEQASLGLTFPVKSRRVVSGV